MSPGRRAVLAGALALPAAARAQCRLAPVAVVPLTAVEGFPVVAGMIDATPATFILDTGAQAHLLLPAAQAALRLPALAGTVPLIGTGGLRDAPIVLLDGVRLGGAALVPAPTPVAPLPVVPRVTPMLAGLLGALLFEQFDLLLDAPSATLGLFRAGDCGGASPRLAREQTAVPLSVQRDRQALLPVRLNGQEVVALLDSGSRATLLTPATASRLGLRAPVSANTARGVDGESLPVGHTTVREMAVGADVVRDMPVSISPLELGPADMLLGFDYIRRRTVFVSELTGQLVIALPPPPASER